MDIEAIILKICKCPFQFFFGIPCAGCGMTRAVLSCLNGNWKQAFYYHPLFWILPVLLLLLIKKKTVFTKIITYNIIILFFIVYMIRLLGIWESVIPCSVLPLEINLQNGFLYQIFLKGDFVW